MESAHAPWSTRRPHIPGCRREEQLLGVARSRSLPHGIVRRAQIVLACAEGESNAAIAERMGLSNITVGKWRRRYRERGLEGLHDEPRAGRPRTHEDERVAEVINTALRVEPPNATQWSVRSMAEHAGVSKSTVQRWFDLFGELLAEDLPRRAYYKGGVLIVTTTNVKVLGACALTLLVCATGVSMAEVPLASSGPPDSDLDIGIWTDFTTAWNGSHETEYTPRELRASLPGVTTADVAWVLAERDFNQEILVSTPLSPEQLLLEQPRLRLAGKAVGESDWLSVATASDPVGYSRILAPGSPVDATKEELLWSSLEEILGDLASLRGSVPIRELLWVRIAQNLDELTWRETDLTADDLLSMPRYGLVRKIYADGMTEMTINHIVIDHNASVLGTDSTSTRCEYYFKVQSVFCEFLDTVCPIRDSDCGLAAVNCWCKAECELCECEGGEPENGHCFKDCCDNENNCVPSG